jgi:phage FluMu protein Com
VAKYRCKHCRKVVERDSEKAWIKSMCDAIGYKTVHLMRVEQAV